jgi:hypothetical protein
MLLLRQDKKQKTIPEKLADGLRRIWNNLYHIIFRKRLYDSVERIRFESTTWIFNFFEVMKFTCSACAKPIKNLAQGKATKMMSAARKCKKTKTLFNAVLCCHQCAGEESIPGKCMSVVNTKVFAVYDEGEITKLVVEERSRLL